MWGRIEHTESILHAQLSFRTMVADIQATTDFDRFQIMIAKKQRRDLARKAYAKERKANA